MSERMDVPARGEDPKAPRSDDRFQSAMDAIDRGDVRPTNMVEASRDNRRLFSRESGGRDTRRSTR
jgi:hypothetical protein